MSSSQIESRPPLPPFDEAAAWAEVLGAEAARIERDPEHVVLASTPDSVWPNRNTSLR